MISLITATFGRIAEIERLLQSLSSQTFKDFELIIVDQNEHHELEKIVSHYDCLNIKYIRSGIKGLSHNRNIGLKYVTGELIGFPDDDCYYDSNLLEKVVDTFRQNIEYKLVAVAAKDPKTHQPFIMRNRALLYRRHIYRFCISYNFFIRWNEAMSFDERLGVGAMYGSGEETDFIWEFFDKNDKGCFVSDSFVWHPSNSTNTDIQRAYKYGLGFGAIFKKEIFKRKKILTLLIFVYYLCRTVGGILFTNIRKVYISTLKGRIKGFLSFEND